MCVYNWRFDGSWAKLLFNFPADIIGGHLWFVPMLCGLYLIMPLLSPWAEKVTKRELLGWIALWAFTTTFPYLRAIWGGLFGAPSFGAVPYLYGECPWSGFGMFHYVSGFFGYMLLGFYFRKFGTDGAFYQRVVRPLADASYGTYLIHMLVLAEVVAFLQPRLTAPLAIAATAAVSFVVSSMISMLLRRIPRLVAWLCG